MLVLPQQVSQLDVLAPQGLELVREGGHIVMFADRLRSAAAFIQILRGAQGYAGHTLRASTIAGDVAADGAIGLEHVGGVSSLLIF